MNRILIHNTLDNHESAKCPSALPKKLYDCLTIQSIKSNWLQQVLKKMSDFFLIDSKTANWKLMKYK